MEVSLDLFGNVRGQEEEDFVYLTNWCDHKDTGLFYERVCDVTGELDIARVDSEQSSYIN